MPSLSVKSNWADRQAGRAEWEGDGEGEEVRGGGSREDSLLPPPLALQSLAAIRGLQPNQGFQGQVHSSTALTLNYSSIRGPSWPSLEDAHNSDGRE